MEPDSSPLIGGSDKKMRIALTHFALLRLLAADGAALWLAAAGAMRWLATAGAMIGLATARAMRWLKLGEKCLLRKTCVVAAALVFGSIFSLLSAPLISAQEKAPLQGSVQQFAEPAKALDPLLWPGNNFDRAAARSLRRDPNQEPSKWQKIPDWQAGNWACEQAVNTRAIKYLNGAAVETQPLGVHKSMGSFTKGLLKDKNGGVWNWLQSDYWIATDHGQQIQQSYVIYTSAGGGDYPDFYAESLDFNVDKNANQILTSRRAKVWTRYTKLAPGMLKEETLRTNYDFQGHPTVTAFNTALYKRTETFESYYPGFASKKAIVDNFHNYLRAHGFANLIPATTAVKSGKTH